MNPLVTPERLVRWLRSKPETDIVGCSSSFETCPLANFLCEELGVAQAGVNVQGCVIKDRDKEPLGMPTPRWCQVFINVMDRRGNLSPIVAADALRIFRTR